jgi:hypothetical protein
MVGFVLMRWRLYQIETPLPAASLCESGGLDATSSGRPLSLKAWLLNDLSSREYNSALSGQLNRAHRWELSRLGGIGGGVMITFGEHFSSV